MNTYKKVEDIKLRDKLWIVSGLKIVEVEVKSIELYTSSRIKVDFSYGALMYQENTLPAEIGSSKILTEDSSKRQRVIYIDQRMAYTELEKVVTRHKTQCLEQVREAQSKLDEAHTLLIDTVRRREQVLSEYNKI